MANEREIPIKIPEGVLAGVYANQMVVRHSREEFILDFITLTPPEGVVSARVIVSPGHLKRMITALAENLELVNPAWVEASWFRGCDALRVDENEPHAANALRIGDGVLVAAAFPRTLERMRSRGLAVVTTECNELAKAEGAVTCCSLVFEARASGAI